MNRPIKIIILGGGSRGTFFSNYFADHPDKIEVVGVAEPRDYWRKGIAKRHNIPAENVFKSWIEVSKRGKFADAVVIATQDKMHRGPAIIFADMNYHIMLEKPMATTEQSCEEIIEAVLRNDVIFAVCHSLRYTADTQKVKAIIDSGAIGDVINIQRLEPVGFWHQAHSFVRGEWASSVKSSPMLLAKSCHDIDWIAYFMGLECRSVSSFGSLTHFKKSEKPLGGGFRCIDCKIESTCPYSALRQYMDILKTGDFTWPLDIITSEFSVEGVERALTQGPYGVCVYECNNDVVDTQVVNMLFEQGRTASLTMTAFCDHTGRKTNIFGTKGHLYVNENIIEHFDFLTRKTTIIEANKSSASIVGGHGGGDYVLAEKFIKAIQTNDQSQILSGPQETLHTHRIVFSAEEARITNSVVDLKRRYQETPSYMISKKV